MAIQYGRLQLKIISHFILYAAGGDITPHILCFDML